MMFKVNVGSHKRIFINSHVYMIFLMLLLPASNTGFSMSTSTGISRICFQEEKIDIKGHLAHIFSKPLNSYWTKKIFPAQILISAIS